MKEFEFDDIVISDEPEEEKPKKESKIDDSDSLYQKFSFDIDDVEEIKEVNTKEIDEEKNINDLFEEKEEEKEDKPLFSNSNEDIDNPFKNTLNTEEEKDNENIYEEENKNMKPIISFNEEEIENKEDALEEALSHTTKFTPFKEEKPSINTEDIEETKDGKETNGIAYLIALFIILLIAIFVIPKIASLL